MSKQFKLPLLILSGILAIYFGWDMHQLTQQETLWGYRPLFFFTAFLTFFSLLWAEKMTVLPIQWRLLRLATFGGAILALGFPPFPLTFLIFIGFIPFLQLEKDIAESREGTSKWTVFKYSFHGFLVWNILATYWIANTTFVASLFAFFVNSFLMTIPFVLFHQTKKTMGETNGYMAFVAYWITFEYLHLHWDLSWPWLTLGNSLSEWPIFVQWFEYTGVFGGSLWILIINYLIFKFINRVPGESHKGYLIPVLLIAPMLISTLIYVLHEEKGKEQQVVIVQPNYEPHYKKFNTSRKEQLAHFLKLSKEAVTNETDYLVFPETSFGSVWKHKLDRHEAVKGLREFTSGFPNLKLVTGVSSYYKFKEGEVLSPTARPVKFRDSDKIAYHYDAYNSATQFQAGVDTLPFYNKSILVPGAEKMPFPRYLKFLESFALELGGMAGSHAGQENREVFFSKDKKLGVAPIICYESIYGEYDTEYVRRGANALFIVTNDGWWDNTAGHKQHLQFATLRAIETRRSIARSANTGISGFINQRGDILQPTQYDEATTVKGSILFNDEITFYTKWGDVIARIALFLSLILLVLTFTRGMMNRKS